MNIEQEIKDISNSIKSAEDIVNDIKIQKAELDKKLHLFNVVSFVTLIEKMFNEGLLEEYEIAYTNFNCEFLDDRGKQGYRINFVFLDKDKNEHSGYYFQCEVSHPNKILDDFLEEMELLDVNNFHSSCIDGSVKTIKMDANCGEEIYKILLSDELNVLLKYSQIKVSLPITNAQNNKKLKL